MISRIALVASIILVVSVLAQASATTGTSNANNPNYALQVTTLTDYATTTFSGVSAYTSYEQQTSYMTTDSFSLQLTVQAPSPQYGCEYEYVPFGTFSGDLVTFQFVSNIPINFYVMDNSSFQAWAKGGTCTVSDYELSSISTSSYNYVWTSPAWADYDALFINTSHQEAATISYSVIGRSQTCCVATSTFTSEVVQMQPFTATSTVTFLSEEQVPMALLFQYGWLLASLAAVVVAVVLVYVYRSKERGKVVQTKLDSVLTPKPTQATLAPTISEATMFCRHCGAKTPRDSKFCKECGTKV